MFKPFFKLPPTESDDSLWFVFHADKLLGKNEDNPNIQEKISIKGCPPQPKVIVKCLQKAGIDVNPAIIENWEENTGLLMKKYEDKQEFEESFFHIE